VQRDAQTVLPEKSVKRILGCHPIKMWCFDEFLPITTEIAIAQIIHQKQNDIWFAFCRGAMLQNQG